MAGHVVGRDVHVEWRGGLVCGPLALNLGGADGGGGGGDPELTLRAGDVEGQEGERGDALGHGVEEDEEGDVALEGGKPALVHHLHQVGLVEQVKQLAARPVERAIEDSGTCCLCEVVRGLVACLAASLEDSADHAALVLVRVHQVRSKVHDPPMRGERLGFVPPRAEVAVPAPVLPAAPVVLAALVAAEEDRGAGVRLLVDSDVSLGRCPL
eukprot:745870-Hanusia_phi.AAC.3